MELSVTLHFTAETSLSHEAIMNFHNNHFGVMKNSVAFLVSVFLNNCFRPQD